MTVDELQRIATRLSNSAWTRHWVHWSYPQRTPWLMAIQVYAFRSHPYTGISTMEPLRLTDLEDRGFALAPGQQFVYTIPRTNEDGTPFSSER